MSEIRTLWHKSKVYRVVLVLALIYTVLRLGVHGFYLATLLIPERLPEWVGAEHQSSVPVDLQLYLDAAHRFRNGEALYHTARRIEVYQYSPSYALFFTPFLSMTPTSLVIFQTIIHIAAYLLTYLWWEKLFDNLHLEMAKTTLASTLPIWLCFSAFWSDLGYLNIYIPMVFIGSLFIEAALKENLSQAVIWLTLILLIKPHWAFALAVPLLLGRYRFFAKLILLAFTGYAIVVIFTMLMGGMDYVWTQYGEYVRFLTRLSHDFPWRGPEEAFLGYNHSIKQIVVYMLGNHSWVFRLATAIKLLFLLPLGLIGLRFLRNPPRKPGVGLPELALDWTFALYLGVFIWLDMVWELSLGIVIFPYLLATLDHQRDKVLIWAVFLPYALIDFIQVVSFALFGMDIVAPGLYVLTDPSIYVPLVMIVILTFYALLIRRLWRSSHPLLFPKVI